MSGTNVLTAPATPAPKQPRPEPRAVINPLKRAQGQLAAVITALEVDAPWSEVISQLSAVSGALDRATVQLVPNALHR